MKALCIDFETANSFVGSICAVGIAVIENGDIIASKEWPVKPHSDYYFFDSLNTMIHGITEKDVRNSPEFNEVYFQLKPYFENAILVSHNAAFDMSCLRNVLELYNLPYPENQYFCTYKAALKTWDGLENYKLNTVCKHIDFSFNHHNAKEDAIACGKVLLAALSKKGTLDIFKFADIIGMRLGKLFPGGYISCSIANKSNFNSKLITAETDVFDPDHEFYKKKVVFSGTLSSMTRKEAMQKVVNKGGIISDGVTEDTDFLVLGLQDFSKFADGKESSKTKKAKNLISKGRKLQIIDEVEFLKLMEL